MRSPSGCESATCTTRPCVAKSGSLRLGVKRGVGMRISRSEPTATSKRVTKAAPFRHKFSLEVSSSKITPRRSRPRTCSGNRTATLRSDRCFETSGLTFVMGWLIISGDRKAVDPRARVALEKAFHGLEYLAGRSRRMYPPAKLAAVLHPMGKPAGELLHFANSVGQLRRINFPIVAGE